MSILPVIKEGIPTELKRHNRWCLWRLEEQGNRWAKVPLTPRNKPAIVSSNRCWFTFDDVWSAYDTGLYSGIGFCLAGDGLVFVDYDSANESLTLDDLGHLGVRGWTEQSPGGRGLHTVVVAKKSTDRCKFEPEHKKIKAIEVYDRNRYFTVTGHTVGPCNSLWANQIDIDRLCDLMPTTDSVSLPVIGNLASHHEILQKMMSSGQWRKIGPLWRGENIDDHSSADLALMNHLAFWTGNDPVAMEILFSMSALGQRTKWINRKDYRYMTIQRAVCRNSNLYDRNRYQEASTQRR